MKAKKYKRKRNNSFVFSSGERLESGDSWESSERRKHLRLARHFPAKLSKMGLYSPVAGVTENVSQGGAFVKTSDRHVLQIHDRTILTIFLPPDFTGQDKTIGLQGSAIISRVDPEKDGVGVRFSTDFKHLRRVRVNDIQEKITHKKLAYYLSTVASLSLPEFCTAYPNGFLVERHKQFFEKNVIIQLSTDVADDTHVLEQIKKGAVNTDALNARVLEIKKRNPYTDPDIVTLGRSEDSDIAIQNKMISRAHTYLYLSSTDETCFLVDIGSTNGTFLNDSKIRPHQKYVLSDGDEICFGPETRVVYFSASGFYKFLFLPIL